MTDFMTTLTKWTGNVELTLAIVMMAGITFAVRYAFFTQKINIKLNDTVKTMLTFTAPCVLTAMFVPIIFQAGLPVSDGGHSIGGDSAGGFFAIFTSAYFWAGVFAIVCSLITRHTLLVIILSMAVFYGLRYVGF